jgi:hypothetical protein
MNTSLNLPSLQSIKQNGDRELGDRATQDYFQVVPEN